MAPAVNLQALPSLFTKHMKLKINQSLRAALVACYSAALPVATTVTTGAFISGSVVCTMSSQAYAEDETVETDTYEDTYTIIGKETASIGYNLFYAADENDLVIMQLDSTNTKFWFGTSYNGTTYITSNVGTCDAGTIQINSWTVTDGSTTKTYNFNSTIIGSGDITFTAWSTTSGATNDNLFVFTGDMSAWEGSITAKANSSGAYGLSVEVTGEASSAASGQGSITIEGPAEYLEYGFTGATTIANSFITVSNLKLNDGGTYTVALTDADTPTLTVTGTTTIDDSTSLVIASGTSASLKNLDLGEDASITVLGSLSISGEITASDLSTTEALFVVDENASLSLTGSTFVFDSYLADGDYIIASGVDMTTIDFSVVLNNSENAEYGGIWSVDDDGNLILRVTYAQTLAWGGGEGDWNNDSAWTDADGDATFTNASYVTITGESDITLDSMAQTSSITLSGDADISVTGEGSILNAGTLSKTGEGDASIGVAISTGAITAEGGSLIFGDKLSTTGAIVASGSDIVLNGELTSVGTTSVEFYLAGTRTNCDVSIQITDGGSVSFNSSAELSSSNILLQSGTLSFAAKSEYAVNRIYLDRDNTSELTTIVVGEGTTVNVAGGADGSSTYSNYNLADVTIVLGAKSTLSDDVTLWFGCGTMTVNGADGVTNENAGVYQLNNFRTCFTIYGGGSVVLNIGEGAIMEVLGTTSINKAADDSFVLGNISGQSVTVGIDGGLIINSFIMASQAATINVNDGGFMQMNAGAYSLGAGTVTMNVDEGATLSLGNQTSGTSQGNLVLKIASGATIQSNDVVETTIVDTNFTFDENATVNFGAGAEKTLQMTSDISGISANIIDAGTVAFTGSTSLNSATIAAGATLTVGNGSYASADGSTSVTIGGVVTSDSLTRAAISNTAITISGDMSYTGVSTDSTTTIDVTSGTLTVDSDSSIASSVVLGGDSSMSINSAALATGLDFTGSASTSSLSLIIGENGLSDGSILNTYSGNLVVTGDLTLTAEWDPAGYRYNFSSVELTDGSSLYIKGRTMAEDVSFASSSANSTLTLFCNASAIATEYNNILSGYQGNVVIANGKYHLTDGDLVFASLTVEASSTDQYGQFLLDGVERIGAADDAVNRTITLSGVSDKTAMFIVYGGADIYADFVTKTNGTIDLQSNYKVTVHGDITDSSSADKTYKTGGGVLDVKGEISVAGTFNLSVGEVTLGDMSLTGGNLTGTISANNSIKDATLTGVTMSSTSTIDVLGTVSLSNSTLTAGMSVATGNSLRIDSSSSLTGDVALDGGTLTVAGTLSNDITLGADSYLASSTTVLELNSTITISSADYSLDLSGAGTVTLGEKFELVLAGDYSTIGEYAVFTGLSNDFSSKLIAVDYENKNTYAWTYAQGNIILSVTEAAWQPDGDGEGEGDGTFTGTESDYTIDTTQGSTVNTGTTGDEGTGESVSTGNLNITGGDSVSITGDNGLASTGTITVGSSEDEKETTVTVSTSVSADKGVTVEKGTVTIEESGSLSSGNITIKAAESTATLAQADGDTASLTTDGLSNATVESATVTVAGDASLSGSSIDSSSTLDVTDGTLTVSDGSSIEADTTLAEDASVTAGLITLTGQSGESSGVAYDSGSLSNNTLTSAVVSNATLTVGTMSVASDPIAAGGTLSLTSGRGESTSYGTIDGVEFKDGSTIELASDVSVTMKDIIINADTEINNEGSNTVTFTGTTTIGSDSSTTTIASTTDADTSVTTTTLTINTLSALSTSTVSFSGDLVLSIELTGDAWTTFLDGLDKDHTFEFALACMDSNTVANITSASVEIYGGTGDSYAAYSYTGGAVSYADGSILISGGEVVPEPSTATLSLLALAGLLARRRRRKG